jgi:RHS repeat-associated protein
MLHQLRFKKWQTLSTDDEYYDQELADRVYNICEADFDEFEYIGIAGAKSKWERSMAVTNFIWDEVGDNVLLETDDSDAVTAAYVNRPEQFGELLSQDRSGARSFYHFDGESTTSALTDANENITDTFIYTAYGEEVARTGTTTNPFGYKGAVGYYTDESTSEIYVRNRSYNPNIGRWLSVDPLGFSDGTNLYQAYFVPNAIDPTGQKVHIFGWEGAGATIGFGNSVIEETYIPIAKREDVLDGEVISKVDRQWTNFPGKIIEAANEIIDIAKTPESDDYCQICYPRIVLIGFSWGGATATKVAAAIQLLEPRLRLDLVFTIDPVLGNSNDSQVFNKVWLWFPPRLVSVTPSNFCDKWYNYYQKISLNPPFHGDQFRWATSETQFGFSDFANGPYNGVLPPGKIKGPQQAHRYIPYLTKVQTDWGRLLRTFKPDPSKDDWDSCNYCDHEKRGRAL